jgi:hypothetical protein
LDIGCTSIADFFGFRKIFFADWQLGGTALLADGFTTSSAMTSFLLVVEREFGEVIATKVTFVIILLGYVLVTKLIGKELSI